ncbi:MAG: aminotransferase class V-fold PLP-dependent enzyme, partial [Bacteroidales bacterium]|nr:aminotransferase class V-fold PLP-dependent enzyme [Bacteroidales bacterium]
MNESAILPEENAGPQVTPANSAGSASVETLRNTIWSTLETYANVHRGSGQYSQVTTHLYEKARDLVLDYAGKSKSKYTVIFCSPMRAITLAEQLEQPDYVMLSSEQTGIQLGVCALVVKKNALKNTLKPETGGGTTRLYSQNWVMWAGKTERFEAGTPAIVNVIAFAKALSMIGQNNINFGMEDRSTLLPGDILNKDNLQNMEGVELLYELRKTLIGKEQTVPTAEGDKPFINFDNSASTPTFEPVFNAFMQALFLNRKGRQKMIGEVKNICSKILNAPTIDYDIFFTSNTTESINLVAGCQFPDENKKIQPVVLTTMLEHSSNDLPWRQIPGYELIRLPVSNEGFWSFEELEKILDEYNGKKVHGNKRITHVAVSGASNVLGTCNDLKKTGEFVHRYKACFIVDAAQLVAHRKVDVRESGIDFLAFSAHKVYAPFGCGVLVAKKDLLRLSDQQISKLELSEAEIGGGIAALGKSLLLLDRIGFDVIQYEEMLLVQRV